MKTKQSAKERQAYVDMKVSTYKVPRQMQYDVTSGMPTKVGPHKKKAKQREDVAYGNRLGTPRRARVK